MEIRGKKAVVTGGANGIGRAVVERLVSAGAQAGVFDVDESALSVLKKSFPDVFCRKCDLTRADDVECAVEEFFHHFHSIDILINCAGIVHNEPLLSFSLEGFKKHSVPMWDRVIATNLSAVFYTTLPVAQKMLQERTQGLIINISSICAAGNAGQSAYSAAKAGVNALTVTLAKELGGLGIRVAGIAPGFANTKTTINSISDIVLDEWKRQTPLRRIATPEEIVDGVLFIVKNDFFHGRILEIDGGLRI
ncbi:MAG: SDR family NAD(P)-dependent oxidoreductase [Bacillota bacterium]